MTRALLLAAGLALFPACKERGEARVSISFEDQSCQPFEGTELIAYAVLGVESCQECACGGCFDACDADNCARACGGEVCSLEELDRGIVLEPPEAGLYAVVFELTRVDATGVRRVIASACALVELDPDGTADKREVAQGECCL